MQLGNHLGNVLTTISDKKFGVSSNGSLIDYYEPHMVTGTDYYPFGMPMRYGGSNTGQGYRFGFNGKENDNEVKWGMGNQVDFGARIYDSRVGRWLSTDPLQKVYPSISPYVFVANNPIIFIDPDGQRIILSGTQKEKEEFTAKLAKLTGLQLELQKDGNIKMIGNNSDPQSKVLKNIVLDLLDEKGKKYNNDVLFKLVTNDEGFTNKRYGKVDGNSIYFDNYNTGAFDMDDFRAIKDDAVYAAFLGHIIAERGYVDNYKSVIEEKENFKAYDKKTRTLTVEGFDAKFANAHVSGQLYEALILSEFFVDESGKPIKLNPPDNGVNAESILKTGKAKFEYGGVVVNVNSEGTADKANKVQSVEVKVPNSSIKRKE